MPEKTKASKDNSLKLATLQHNHGDFNLLVTTNFKYHLLRISMKFNQTYFRRTWFPHYSMSSICCVKSSNKVN